MQELRTVRIYGRLGAKFGRVHRLAVSSVAEAAAALCAIIPGFEREFLGAAGGGARYACFVGRRNVGEQEIHDPSGPGDIRIAPILAGAKQGGLFQVVLGAALIAASFIPGMQGFTIAAGVTAKSMVLSMGVSMLLGGVLQMISPQPRGLSAKDSQGNGASYNFNGPVNTTAQGNCYPVLYGEMFVGSQVLSAGIFSEDKA